MLWSDAIVLCVLIVCVACVTFRIIDSIDNMRRDRK